MHRIAYSACIALALVGTTVQAQARSSKAKAAAKKSSTAAAWKKAYGDENVTVSVDTKHTAKESDGTYSAHLKWAYAADQSIGRNKSYRSMVETRLINCDSLTTKSLRATTYSAAGTAVSSYDTKPTDVQYLAWSSRKPGSTGQNAIEGVCKTITTP